MKNIYKRGEIYYVNFDPAIGCEQGGIRPALIIQNNKGNYHSNTTIVASITTSHKKFLPTHIQLGDLDFLDVKSTVLLEQIRTIDVQRVQKYIGSLKQEKMRQINKALLVSLGLKQSISNNLVITLCQSCAQVFYESPYHSIYRADQNQELKEPCTYCNVNEGFDYIIKPRPNLDKR